MAGSSPTYQPDPADYSPNHPTSATPSESEDNPHPWIDPLTDQEVTAFVASQGGHIEPPPGKKKRGRSEEKSPSVNRSTDRTSSESSSQNRPPITLTIYRPKSIPLVSLDSDEEGGEEEVISKMTTTDNFCDPGYPASMAEPPNTDEFVGIKILGL